MQGLKPYLSIFLLTALGACGGSHTPDVKATLQAPTSTQVVTPTPSATTDNSTGNVYGDKILSAMATALSTSLTSAQVSVVTNAAAGKATEALAIQGFFLDATETAKLMVAAEALIAGAVGALDEAGLSAADATGKEQIKTALSNMHTAAIKVLEIENIVTALKADERNTLIGSILRGQVEALDEGGLKGAPAVEILGDVFKESIKSFDDASIPTAEIADLLKASLGMALSTLPDSGLEQGFITDAASAMAKASTVALADFKLNPEEMGTSLQVLTETFISSLYIAGLRDSAIAPAAKNVMGAIFSSLDEAGLSKDEVKSVADPLVASATGELGALSAYAEMKDLMGAVVEGAVGNLFSAGLVGTDIGLTAKNIAQSIIMELGNLDEIKSSQIVEIGTAVSTAVFQGLQAAGYTSRDIEGMTQELNASINEGVQQEIAIKENKENSINWSVGGACANLPVSLDLTNYHRFSYGDNDGNFCEAPANALETYCDTFNSMTGVSGGIFELVTSTDSKIYCTFKPTLMASKTKWESQCKTDSSDINNITSLKNTIEFHATNKALIQTYTYAEADCDSGNLDSILSIDSTVTAGDLLPNSKGVRKINYTIESVTLKPVRSASVSVANKAGSYGKTDWQIMQDKDISGLAKSAGKDLLPNVGDVFYDIFRIAGTTISPILYFGDTSSLATNGTSESTRPTGLEIGFAYNPVSIWTPGDACEDLSTTADLSFWHQVAYSDSVRKTPYFCAASQDSADDYCSKFSSYTGVDGGTFELVTDGSTNKYCQFKPILSGLWKRSCKSDGEENGQPVSHLITQAFDTVVQHSGGVETQSPVLITTSTKYRDAACGQENQVAKLILTYNYTIGVPSSNPEIFGSRKIDLALVSATYTVTSGTEVLEANLKKYYTYEDWTVNVSHDVLGKAMLASDSAIAAQNTLFYDLFLVLGNTTSPEIYFGYVDESHDRLSQATRPSTLQWAEPFLQ